MLGKTRGILALLFVLTFSASLPAPARAQVKTGEIININYKYKVAFADLNQNDVQPGDKVAVKNTEGATIYLVAIEVYPVMVKLTIPTEPGYVLTEDQFAKIAVGSDVTVVDQSKFRSQPPAVAQANPDKTSISPVSGNAGQMSVNPQGPTTINDTGKAFVPVAQVPVVKEFPRPKNNVVYDPSKISVRTEAVTEKAVPPPVQEVPKPAVPPPAALPPAAVVPPVDQNYKVTMLEQKVDRLVDSNLTMADQITKLLKDKAALEAALREKDVTIDISRKQVLSMSNQSSPQDQKLQDLEKQNIKLKEDKAAANREIASLNTKLAELKKKLARMVELVNKHLKNYE